MIFDHFYDICVIKSKIKNKIKKPKASFSLESLKRTKIKMYQRHRKAREVSGS